MRLDTKVMSDAEDLKAFMEKNNVKGELLTFSQSCHSVKEAARAVNSPPETFVKNIGMVDEEGHIIVAVVKGEDRASASRVAKVLGVEGVRTMTPEEISEKTGYPAGGVPSFGFEAVFLIDPRVMEKDVVYTGGGNVTSLVRISPKELQKANKGKIVRVRK